MTRHRFARGLRAGTLLAGAALLARHPGLAASEHQLLVRVTDAMSGRALANTEVTELGSGTRRWTDAAGEARFTLGSAAGSRIRVRQLGYRFVERVVVPRGDAGTDTLAVALERVAMALPATVASAASTCVTEVDTATSRLSLVALGQLRFAAEQYDQFRNSYPFRVTLARRTVAVHADGVAGKAMQAIERVDGRDWGERYRPGEVLRMERQGFNVAILFVSMLADSTFWARHCLVARGVRQQDEHRVLALEFSPSPDLRDPDWMGTALLDSATSELRRIEFQLVGLDDSRSVRRLEGYITFATPSPHVARPDSVMAAWWYAAPTDGMTWGAPNVVQLLHVLKVDYLKGPPP